MHVLKVKSVEKKAIGNENTSKLEKFLRENPDLRSYLQEVVEKIVENKAKAPLMAKISSIFFKCWLFHSANLERFYATGLLTGRVIAIHCPYEPGCIICKKYPDGWDCWTTVYCRITITDP